MSFLVIIPLILNWIQLSHRSLFIDEFRTFHTISGGLGQIWVRFPESGLLTPIYYFFPWLSSAILGPSELALRLPSFIFIVVSTFFIYRIAQYFFDDKVAVLACLIFLAGEEIVFAAALARPYALVLAFETASIWMLVRWRVTGRRAYQFSFIALTALMVYTHPLAAIFWPVSALIMIFPDQILRRIYWKEFVLSWAFILILLAPLTPSFLSLLKYRGAFEWLAKPTALEFIYALSKPMPQMATITLLMLLSFQAPMLGFHDNRSTFAYLCCMSVLALSHPLFLFLPLLHGLVFAVNWKRYLQPNIRNAVLVFLGLGVIALFIYWRRGALWAPWGKSLLPTKETLPGLRESLFGAYRPVAALLSLAAIFLLPGPKWSDEKNRRVGMFLGWLIIPISTAFLISVFSSSQIFLSRYYVVWFPGVAVIMAVILDKLGRPILIAVFTLLVVAGSILNSQIGWTPYTQEDWRSAIHFANAQPKEKDAVIVLAPHFVEASQPDWLNDPILRQQLLSPAEFYRLEGNVLLFPSAPEKPQLRPYLEDFGRSLAGHSEVVLVSSWLSNDLINWFKHKMASPDVRVDVYPFNGNRVVLFKAAKRAASQKIPQIKSVTMA